MDAALAQCVLSAGVAVVENQHDSGGQHRRESHALDRVISGGIVLATPASRLLRQGQAEALNYAGVSAANRPRRASG